MLWPYAASMCCDDTQRIRCLRITICRLKVIVVLWVLSTVAILGYFHHQILYY